MTQPPPKAEIVVVPHTHWDREWYEPFQRFRLRLVALLDDVIPRLEREPEFRFTLDGQTAAIDDYPRGPARVGASGRGARPRGTADGRTLAGTARRVPVLRREHRPQPRDGSGPR